MASEDVAIVVGMARRLSQKGTRPQARQPADRQWRGNRGRGLRTEAYLRFWTMYQAALRRQDLDWGQSRPPQPRSYYTTPSPLTGASFSASFARNRLLRHEMYINRGSREANLELLTDLEAHRDTIREAYGRHLKLEFENPGPERRAVRLAEYRDGHISHSDEFDTYVDWFIDRGIRLRRAIEAYQTESG